MATQPVDDFDSSAFLDRIPRGSGEAILANSATIRYAAGTIAFQPWERAEPRFLKCVSRLRV